MWKLLLFILLGFVFEVNGWDFDVEVVQKNSSSEVLPSSTTEKVSVTDTLDEMCCGIHEGSIILFVAAGIAVCLFIALACRTYSRSRNPLCCGVRRRPNTVLNEAIAAQNYIREFRLQQLNARVLTSNNRGRTDGTVRYYPTRTMYEEEPPTYDSVEMKLPSYNEVSAQL